jgi:hypothetical protein
MPDDLLLRAERMIAEAAARPLQDAAYALYRQEETFDRLELDAGAPRADDAALEAARARSIAMAKVRHHRAKAHTGPTLARLKRAPPEASDEALKTAIKAAVKFNDDCFAHYPRGCGDDWDKATRAVARAAQDNAGYREETLEDARNRVAFYMK